MSLLDSLRSLKPRGGDAGALITEGLIDQNNDGIVDGLDDMLSVNAFRPTLTNAVSIEAMWPFLLLLGGWVFFFDVLVRRVAIHFEWVKTIWNKVKAVFGRTEEAAQPSRLSRLQSRKAEIDKKFEERRAATRFEPSSSDSLDEKASGQQQLDSVLNSERRQEKQAPPAARADANIENEDPSTYTSRLLDAKRRAQKKRDKE